MKTCIALLRAVNVGGTGKLPMSELKAMCEAEGFVQVQTYIASGNVVFQSKLPVANIIEALEKRLAAYAGKTVGVIVRTTEEMKAVLAGNPFLEAEPNRTVVIFLPNKPPSDTLDRLRGLKHETVKLGARELYVHYPDGQGASKLVIPAAAAGTARNMNTVSKLVEIATATA
ncbi:MAG: DUF1697 domain-containing protein [Verrucomicrobia bacterium]|nr:DUF1697 domain-containing protein [Verrucomicrobiota bacterium]